MASAIWYWSSYIDGTLQKVVVGKDAMMGGLEVAIWKSGDEVEGVQVKHHILWSHQAILIRSGTIDDWLEELGLGKGEEGAERS